MLAPSGQKRGHNFDDPSRLPAVVFVPSFALGETGVAGFWTEEYQDGGQLRGGGPESSCAEREGCRIGMPIGGTAFILLQENVHRGIPPAERSRCNTSLRLRPRTLGQKHGEAFRAA